jgi:hypothetical protein
VRTQAGIGEHAFEQGRSNVVRPLQRYKCSPSVHPVLLRTSRDIPGCLQVVGNTSILGCVRLSPKVGSPSHGGGQRFESVSAYQPHLLASLGRRGLRSGKRRDKLPVLRFGKCPEGVCAHVDRENPAAHFFRLRRSMVPGLKKAGPSLWNRVDRSGSRVLARAAASLMGVSIGFQEQAMVKSIVARSDLQTGGRR